MMLDHVSITVNDLEKAAPFYDAVLLTLGIPCVWRSAEGIGYGLRSHADFEGEGCITILARSGVVADRRHWAFRAKNRAVVSEFHAAGLAAGGRDDGPPGMRANYHAAYFAAFLLDPDGNRIEAVCHREEP